MREKSINFSMSKPPYASICIHKIGQYVYALYRFPVSCLPHNPVTSWYFTQVAELGYETGCYGNLTVEISGAI